MEMGTKYYELSYLVKPELTPEDATRVEEELRALLGERQAVLESWDGPKQRRLSYPIGKATEAYIGALRFVMSKEHVDALRAGVKKNKNLLRFMLLGWRKPSPQRERRAERKERPKEVYVPTDEKALNEKLEEIFAKQI